MAVPLSTDDLGMFFSARHGALASQLRAGWSELEAVVCASDPRVMNPALARACDLFRWVAPVSGAIDTRAICVIREALGYLSPRLDAVFAASALGAFCVSQAASAIARESLLDKYRSGEVVFGFALSEPNAGSDAASLQTIASADGDGFRLSGTKCLISNASIASHFVVFATVDPKLGHRGITGFIVDGSQDGVRCEPIRLSVDHPIGTVSLSNCRVERAWMLGDRGKGFPLAMETLNTFRATVGAAAVGMARRALAETVAHVTRRVQFGKPLAAQQIVRCYLADMATELDASRLMVLRAAYARDHEQSNSSFPAMAKLFATETAQRIIDKAVQLFGGQGVVANAVVENLYRSIRPLRIYEGTSEIQRLIIGRSLVNSE